MKTIGIYPGRFQPPHKGHLEVYRKLKSIAGPETFVVSTNKIDPPNSPLTFAEKEQVWVKHGVPSNYIVQVKNGYTPTEVVSKHPGAAVIFALGEKDKQRLVYTTTMVNGKETWMLKNGKPGYFQPYEPNKNNMETGDKRGYVIIFDDVKIDGKDISGTDVRNALGSKTQTDENKRKFFQWAFGWFDPSLYKLLTDKFSSHDTNFKPSEPNLREYIENLIRECIVELLGPPPSSTPGGMSSTTINLSSTTDEPDKSEEDLAKAKIDAQNAKKQVERDLDAKKKELLYQKRNTDNLRKDKIPDLEKQRQDLNKKISGQI